MRKIKKEAKQRTVRDRQESHGVTEVVNLTYIVHPVWPGCSFHHRREQCWTLQGPDSDLDLQDATATPKCSHWKRVLDCSLLRSPRSGTTLLEVVELLQNCTCASRDKIFCATYEDLCNPRKGFGQKKQSRNKGGTRALCFTLFEVLCLLQGSNLTHIYSSVFLPQFTPEIFFKQ